MAPGPDAEASSAEDEPEAVNSRSSPTQNLLGRVSLPSPPLTSRVSSLCTPSGDSALSGPNDWAPSAVSPAAEGTAANAKAAAGWEEVGILGVGVMVAILWHVVNAVDGIGGGGGVSGASALLIMGLLAVAYAKRRADGDYSQFKRIE